ncbi:Mannose-6-phosphate isomerase [Anaerovibrio sp. JC8]|uniref:type I phosphomannose isomerase catalytic subunit n=1 Tax=Anaerovibrio sp. JC8 TaxID=1240085 RepID=UPI000A0E0DA5|nr:type I phosphomannose isomerase catalytic subunit [Anaerovibrio sp. JC8]ORU00989.1 Mannose-6-phosphate isomerase [Anaerovibrio sp. JC8]
MIGTSKGTGLNKPFLLRPTGKDYIWGGRRLNDDFSKNIDMSPLAETWECSTHPDGPSFVVGGQFDGRPLSDVLSEHPEFLGDHPQTRGELPILIKFIDAKKDLSVQVHPDDEYAQKYENGQLGKSEMWYVLDAKQDAQLVYGLNHDVDADTMRHSIENGTVEKHLQKVSIKPDDVFFIEAGTIHAIGAGALVAEIQESSNLTYRLYDYNRTDKFGNKRELHIEKGLAVANLKGSGKPKQPVRSMKYRQGCAKELLCRCKYFEVHRMLVNTERVRQLVEYGADETSFRVLLCTNGCGTLFINENEYIKVFRGDCIFFPANSETVKIHGKIQFLDIHG